jgi:D-psicose/D-tagatose/L-ribulose 3-epimerase
MPVKIAVNTWLFALRFTDQACPSWTPRANWASGRGDRPCGTRDIASRKMRTEFSRRGLTCSSVAVICGEGRDLRGSKEEQRAALEYLKACIDTTGELECGLLNGPLYSRVGRADAKPGDPRQEQLRLVADHLRALDEHAEKRGVRLGIEPILRFETDLINTCAEALELIALSGSERLGVHLDTFHMNVEEANPVLAVVRAGASC